MTGYEFGPTVAECLRPLRSCGRKFAVIFNATIDAATTPSHLATIRLRLPSLRPFGSVGALLHYHGEKLGADLFYGTMSEGTVNEHKGCMVGTFDLADGTFSPGRLPVMIEGEKCSPDIVDKSMQHPLMGNPRCNRKLIIGGEAKLKARLKARFAGPESMCSFV